MSHAKSLQTTPTTQHLPQAAVPTIGSVTSSFFVQIGDLLGDEAGPVAEVPNAVHLLWYTSIEERPSIGVMTSDFQASSTLIHSLVEMHILTDSKMPTLREALRNNTPIETIKITRVGHLGEGSENTEMYSSEFTNCFLESIEDFPDKLIIKARITQRSDVANTTGFDGKQETEAGAGATASGWNYEENSDALGGDSGGG